LLISFLTAVFYSSTTFTISSEPPTAREFNMQRGRPHSERNQMLP